MDRSEVLRGSAIAAVALGMALLLNIPFLGTYTVSGDDFTVVLHSARFFEVSPAGWVLEGFQEYDIAYPELGTPPTHWLRPTLNATVYLDSWLARSPTSAWLLTTNYLGYGLMLLLVYLVARSVLHLAPRLALVATVVFAGTVSNSVAFWAIAYRGDMLCTVFGLAAVLAMHVYTGQRHRRWLGLAVLLTVPAVFAKEAALAIPALLAVLLLVRTGNRLPPQPSRLRASRQAVRATFGDLLVLLIPLVIYGAIRLFTGEFTGAYALDDLPRHIMGIPIAVLNPFRFAATAFFPIETAVLKDLVDGDRPGTPFEMLAWCRSLIALGLNGIGWLGLVVLLRTDRAQRQHLLTVLVLGLLASGLPIVLKADPRYMLLGQSVMVPLFVLVMDRLIQTRPQVRRARQWLVPVGLALLLLVNPLYFGVWIAHQQAALVAMNDSLADLHAVIQGCLQDDTLVRIYMVNDPPGMGGLNKLKLYRLMAGRNDVSLRLVNNLVGYDPTTVSDGEGVEFDTARDGTLRVRVRIGAEERFFFYLTPEDAAHLGEPDLITYGPITEFATTSWSKSIVAQKELEFFIPDADRGDFIIIGFDPGVEDVHIYSPQTGKWQPAS